MRNANQYDIKFSSSLTVQTVSASLSDKYVYNAARVSTLGQGVLEDSGEKKMSGLISYLMKNRHGTPFEHNSITFFISAPIFVFREFMRHRIGFSYNEESGRYRILQPIFYLPDNSRPLVQSGKTGEYIFLEGSKGQTELLKKNLADVSITSYIKYREMLDSGIAREVARMILPINIYSSMYVTCNARSIMSFVSLRTRDDESKFKSFPMEEIDRVGREIEKQWGTHMPITHAAFIKYGRVSP